MKQGHVPGRGRFPSRGTDMLTKFVERPAMRQAFKDNAGKVRLPFDPRSIATVVPSCGSHHSAVSTAFDYLARFRIARAVMTEVPERGVTLWDTGWVAEEAVAMMEGHPTYGGAHAHWAKIAARARSLFYDFINGKDVPVEKVATCAQYLANVDLLARIHDFRPDFRERPQVQQELLSLNAAFDPVAIFDPKEVVLLNPCFAAGGSIGSVDADLIVDTTVVDIKTTIDPALTPAHLRGLVGYAAIHEIGGVDIGPDDAGTPQQWNGPVTDVGIYFSRHGTYARWSLDEIMPDGGFSRYVEAFRAEMPAHEAEMAAVAAPAPSPG